MEGEIDFLRFVHALWRRAWLVLMIGVIGTGAALAVAWILPSVYSSTALILIEQAPIPSELARSTVTTAAAARIELMRQQALTTENLAKILENTGVPADQQKLAKDDQIDLLRESITLESVDLGGSRGRGSPAVSAFTLAFEAEDPGRAAAVANALATMIVDENTQTRLVRAADTTSFFRNEVRRTLDDLTTIEQQIADLRDANSEHWPETIAVRRSELTGIDERLSELDRQLLEVQQQHQAAKRALANGEYFPPTFDFGEDGPAEDRRLSDLRRTLIERSAVLSNSHPEIRSLQRQIRALANADATNNGTTNIRNQLGSPGNPTNQSTDLELRIEQLEGRIALLSTQRESVLLRKEALTSSIAATPKVELAFNRLVRRRQTVQAQYEQAVAKLAEAELGEKLEVDGQAERFEIVQQAEVPTFADAPDRKVILAGGLVGSFGAGFALVILLEFLRKTIRNAEDLKRHVHMTPFGVIPHVATSAEIRRRRWLRRIAVLIVLATLYSTYRMVTEYVAPLDELIETVRTRISPATELSTDLNTDQTATPPADEQDSDEAEPDAQ